MRRSTPVRLGVVLALLVACGPKTAKVQTSAVDQHLELAKGHERNRRYDLAEVEYKRALATASQPRERHRARRAYADALIFWGKYPEAARVLEDLVGEAPSSASAWHDLGMMRATKLSDPTGAERALRKSVALAEGDPRPRIALAALLVNRRRFPEAQKQYRELLKLELPDKIRGAVRKAIELLDKEMAADPSTRSSTGR